ncbi:redox-sensing transcriptional repressor Rex [Occallatibacter savannae]|uniref:redox-sensing transcriptional repressor Rex n=1 Tax=Occallatibacter savannae TaxID=1002691 RepID=UPI00194ED423|nr:redox-sensing transcriptional repressor Rex [Occallatibacter savannae]
MNIDTKLSIHAALEAGSRAGIPQPSLNRLPQYHHYLAELNSKGISRVSCSLIGTDLNLVPVQVRKDLQYTGIVGKPKTGYSVPELIQAIESFLGWNNVNEAFLVGAGNLGTALLGHERFSNFGLSIVAAFDADPEKIGQWIHGKAVLPLEKLADLAQRMSIHLGIITAPAEFAQAIADEMVRGGIQALWNFAPVRLKVPAHIIVHNEDLYSSLASLSWKLARRYRVPIQQDGGFH